MVKCDLYVVILHIYTQYFVQHTLSTNLFLIVLFCYYLTIEVVV